MIAVDVVCDGSLDVHDQKLYWIIQSGSSPGIDDGTMIKDRFPLKTK